MLFRSQSNRSQTQFPDAGQWKTLELVSHNYWWPGISRYVASYMAGCNACNCCKSFPTQKVGKLTPNWIPTRCWEVISIDTIRELPESKGYNAILVAVDRLSKHIHAIPTITMVDSTGVACLFLEHVWRHHGLLEAIISDRGSTFISNFSRELAAVGGIMVLCVTRLYRPVLTLRTYHCHYESGIPPLTCFFDQNPGNSFSTCPPNYGVIIS